MNESAFGLAPTMCQVPVIQAQSLKNYDTYLESSPIRVICAIWHQTLRIPVVLLLLLRPSARILAAVHSVVVVRRRAAAAYKDDLRCGRRFYFRYGTGD
jgi:hypothetical protein